MKAVYPGSFDPMTMGHLDIFKRAAKTYDQVTLLFAVNSEKTPKFELDKRLKSAIQVVQRLEEELGKPILVDSTVGLVADYVRRRKIDVIVRGIRDYTDLQYELKVERFNQKLCDAETVYFRPRPEFSDISSSFVSEFIKWDRLDAVKDLVPPDIFNMIQANHSEKG